MMIKLIKPTLEYKDKYIDMIKEWKEYGGIVDYDCNNPIEELDYNGVIKVVKRLSVILKDLSRK